MTSGAFGAAVPVTCADVTGAATPTFEGLVRRAIAQRAEGAEPTVSWADHTLREIAAGQLRAIEARDGGSARGVAVWSFGRSLGANVYLLYLEGGTVTPEEYRQLLAELDRRCTTIAFVPGPLAGIAPATEEALMSELGFARYGRSEMKLERPVPAAPDAGPGTLRPIRPEDEPALARLHRAAYHGRFDRYLFLEEEDEERDSAREVHQLLHGRWGEPEPNGSVVLDVEGRPVAAVIAVRRAEGVLIADVAVDPSYQGRGVGRRVLAASLARLFAAGAGRVYLNVTEGNTRAQRLYASLGFVRSLGPSRDWYNRRAIPVAP